MVFEVVSKWIEKASGNYGQSKYRCGGLDTVISVTFIIS